VNGGKLNAHGQVDLPVRGAAKPLGARYGTLTVVPSPDPEMLNVPAAVLGV
jgi:hypothetical protein